MNPQVSPARQQGHCGKTVPTLQFMRDLLDRVTPYRALKTSECASGLLGNMASLRWAANAKPSPTTSSHKATHTTYRSALQPECQIWPDVCRRGLDGPHCCNDKGVNQRVWPSGLERGNF